MTHDLFLITRTIADIIDVALAQHESRNNPASDDLTQRQAYSMFGEAWVKRCTKIGLATKKRRGTHKNSPLYYSKAELMKIKAAERANNANVFAGTIRNLLTKIVK